MQNNNNQDNKQENNKQIVPDKRLFDDAMERYRKGRVLLTALDGKYKGGRI